MSVFCVQAWDSSGRATVGFDYPACLIDDFTVSSAACPAAVSGNTINYQTGSKSYVLSPGVKYLVALGVPLGGDSVRFLVYEVF